MGHRRLLRTVVTVMIASTLVVACDPAVVLDDPRLDNVTVPVELPEDETPQAMGLFARPPIEQRFLELTGLVGMAEGQPIVSLDWATPVLNRSPDHPAEPASGAASVVAFDAAGAELARATLRHGPSSGRSGEPIPAQVTDATGFTALIEFHPQVDRFRIDLADRTAELAFVRPGPPPVLETALVDATLSVTATSSTRGSSGRDLEVVVSVHDGTRWTSTFLLPEGGTQGLIERTMDVNELVEQLAPIAVETWGHELGAPRFVEVTAIGADLATESIVLGPILVFDGE